MSVARLAGVQVSSVFRRWLQGISLLMMVLLAAGCSATSKLTKNSPRIFPFSEVEKDALAKEGFEPPVVLDARKVLPSDLYSGPYHQVDAEVLNDGFSNQYRIVSKFGVFDVSSTEMLKVRVAELQKIAQVRKMSKAGVVAKSIGKGAVDIALGPLRSLKSAFKIVSSPKKTFDTVVGLPSGVDHAFGEAKGKFDQAKGQVFGGKENKNETTLSEDDMVPVMGPVERGGLAAKNDNIATKYIQNRTGFARRARVWQEKLGIDPYSTNEVLHKELENIIFLDTGVGIALRFVPSVYGAIPGMNVVGAINKYYGQIEKISIYEDPDSIEVKNRRLYQSLAVPDRVMANLGRNEWYSPVDRHNLLEALAKMPDVEGPEHFLRAAVRANSEERAIAFVKAAQYMAALHAGRQKLKTFVAGAEFPAAVAANGKGFIVWPIGDHVTWTKSVAAAVKTTEESLRKAGSGSITFYLSGGASGRARNEMAGMGISPQRMTLEAGSTAPNAKSPVQLASSKQ